MVRLLDRVLVAVLALIGILSIPGSVKGQDWVAVIIGVLELWIAFRIYALGKGNA